MPARPGEELSAMGGMGMKGSGTMGILGSGRNLGFGLLALALAGCAGMNDTQQRALTGTMGGAGVGAILGAIGGDAGLGAAAGAGAGLIGGLLVDHVKKSEQASYNQGYAAGQSRR